MCVGGGACACKTAVSCTTKIITDIHVLLPKTTHHLAQCRRRLKVNSPPFVAVRMRYQHDTMTNKDIKAMRVSVCQREREWWWISGSGIIRHFKYIVMATVPGCMPLCSSQLSHTHTHTRTYAPPRTHTHRLAAIPLCILNSLPNITDTTIS